MDLGNLIVSFLPLILFALLLLFLFSRGGTSQKSIIEATNKAAESNNRLAEAVNRLADVIAKK